MEGKQNMTKMLDTLRTTPPKTIGGMSVTGYEDLRDEDGKMGPFKGETDRSARNFLIFRLSGDGIDAKVCLRPSGTEPKAKAYIEVSCPPPKAGTSDAVWAATCASVDAQAKTLSADFLKMAMTAAGQTV